MPTASGFNPAISGMGIGTVGLGDPNLVIKRKFRWTFEIIGTGANSFRVPPYFVRTAGLPSISIDPTEINFLNDKMWVPGKATWEPISVTFMNVAGTLGGDAANANLDLFKWITSVFDFTAPTRKFMSSRRSDYAGKATINLLDGCGNRLETWEITDAWPESIKFGDGLDYQSSDPLDIELTLRYSQVKFTHHCPALNFTPSCYGCDDSTSTQGYTTNLSQALGAVI